ncbi:hypothetical protein, partial [Burkholderia lata]|uniref:hypothetical protein n=1 Tax=Burkholderia lata (strain ATCC 17760 / DSM 23089 / LMG 22485 / NCIMB 9086 / R18194 / 383) TaxID=482957 RepID=UPI0015815ED7
MSAVVARARRRIGAIVERRDDRAIVIVRHAAQALLEPAALERHRALVNRHEDELEVLLQPCGGAHDGVRPLLGRLRDAGVTVALDAATLAHDASLLEFASWVTQCATPGDTAEPCDATVPGGGLFCGLVVRWRDLRNGWRRPERDEVSERTPQTIAADAAEHIAAGDPDGQVLGALLDAAADEDATGAALDTLSDAVRARRICAAT